MQNSFDKTASRTIDFLEARLQMIEFILTGDCAHDAPQARSDQLEDSVAERLTTLENALSRLSSKSKVVKEILDLREPPPSLGVRGTELIELRYHLPRALPVSAP
jgi:hypothetical protein